MTHCDRGILDFSRLGPEPRTAARGHGPPQGVRNGGGRNVRTTGRRPGLFSPFRKAGESAGGEGRLVLSACSTASSAVQLRQPLPVASGGKPANSSRSALTRANPRSPRGRSNKTDFVSGYVTYAFRRAWTETISGRTIFSVARQLEAGPEPGGDGLVQRGIVGQTVVTALAVGVEGVARGPVRLDALAVEDVLDPLLEPGEQVSQPPRVLGVGLGLDELADVVVQLDQVDEHRPEHLEDQVLLVLLKFGVEAIDHLLAGGLGADLALEVRLEPVILPPSAAIASTIGGAGGSGTASVAMASYAGAGTTSSTSGTIVASGSGVARGMAGLSSLGRSSDMMATSWTMGSRRLESGPMFDGPEPRGRPR